MSQFLLIGAFSEWMAVWLTPIWLLSAGVTAGLAGLLILWGVFWVVSRLPGIGSLGANRRLSQQIALGIGALLLVGFVPFLWNSLHDDLTWFVFLLPVAALGCWYFAFSLLMLVWRRSVDEIPLALTEGVLKPIGIVASCFVGFFIFGYFVVQNPAELLASLSRLPIAGEQESVHVLPVDRATLADQFVEPTEQTLSVDYVTSEMKQLTFRSNQRISLSPTPFVETATGKTWEIAPNEEFVWTRASEVINPFADETVTRIYAKNRGTADAEVTVVALLAPANPEVRSIPWTALAVAAVFLLYLSQRATMPKLSAVSLSTSKSEIAQPMFAIILVVGAALIVTLWMIPYFTMGDDIVMLKNTGMPLIMVLAVIQAVWTASNSVAEEIEGRTALTVLSKPVGRRSFVLGKFLGISWVVLLLFVVLGAVFLIVLAYKPIYDARESSQSMPMWQVCHEAVMQTIPGLALAFMEVIVFAALSVAISTRLPLLPNIVVCFTVFVLGNITPLLVQTTEEGFAIVRFVSQFIATIVPNLETFNVQAAVAAGSDVPSLYVAGSFVYCLLLAAVAMLAALFLFEDRDLA